MSDEIGPQGLLDHVESELARELRLQRREREAGIPAPESKAAIDDLVQRVQKLESGK